MSEKRGGGGGGRYSEKEMAIILKLAAELEAEDADRGGHTLGEIERIAAEAEIDPELVRQAAAAFEAGREPRGSKLYGAPTSFRWRTSIPGELSESELAELVPIIRDVTGKEGTIETVFDSLEWRAMGPELSTEQLEIAPRGGRTEIRIAGHYGNLALARFVGAGIIATLMSVVAGTELHAAVPVELGAIAAIWGAAYLGARTLWQRIAARAAAPLEALGRRLSARVSELQDRRVESGAGADRSLPGDAAEG
ncbi:MAG: hypothetical protein GWN99_11370 [Gemmatimonadetes bacterium]|uniref:Uncharacterized protein n=1 Tax=Candidatus Kutchimonas denitrificans TaxID=3056748 RepID=A0AAE4Z6U3_9BACT|nr:hypothetical protein [Gemmatimonadota bacterium]NIR74083.1 hypothetical protein [Candidatus Kutchimonas denitrificans]NIS01645.1 hypothetical protein [Gemmatimonadota bacterium]NIT67383.1 hypothetical protein [Gemmatimonadota bacterium]NIU52746.1 hypothetical protein [Gemmatimonadota bacterium]